MLDQFFESADLYVQHLLANPQVTADPFFASRQIGFVSISAVTVYEIAMKDIFIQFGCKKHVVLGNFTKSRFDRINGRVSYKSICDEHVKPFGDKYVKRFKKKIAAADKESLRSRRKSILTCYSNIVVWRNSFAHEGTVPNNVTLPEVVDSYQEGKLVVQCLLESMVR